MKVLKMLYEDNSHLIDFIKNNKFNNEYTWLIRIHASTYNKELCEDMAKTVKSMLPNATVIGCTVSGVIYDAKIYEDKTLILFTGFERASVTTDFFSIKGMNEDEIFNHIEKTVEGTSPALALIHIGGISPHSEKVVKRISKSLSHIPFVGGIAACQDAEGNVNSLVFNEEGVYEDTINITYISSDFVLSYTNAIVGHAPISEVHTITATTGEYFDEINGIPSIQWLNEQLGINQLQENINYQATTATDILLRFPFVIEGGDGSSRFAQYDAKENKLRQYYSQIGSDIKFRIGYLSPAKSLEEWQNLCYDLQNTPVETMFCYSCLFRRLFLNNLSKWEMTPFIGQDVCGAFMFGEICTKNSGTHYYNGTCAVFTMAEKVNYIKPDLSVYDRVYELDDTNSQTIETLKNLIKSSGENEDTAWFDNAIKNEELAMLRMQSGDQNMGVFLKQKGRGENLKLCVVHSDIHSLHTKEEDYDFIFSLMTKMKDYVIDVLNNQNIEFYRFGKNSFFFTTENSTGDITFIKIVKNLFDNFKTFENNPKVINFAVTLQGKNPYELVNYIEQFAKQESSGLFNCDKNTEESNDLQKEFEIVAHIKDAIANDRVIPYFQGIYDSLNSRFFAYESLMRIQTANGEILQPGMFLDIAKKHNLYLDLSRHLVCKVLDLFKDRTEVITMNLSSLDVHSERFIKEIFDRLDKMKNPEHFIFELVETEKFAGQEDLRQFIRKLRQYGAKIAIDDFGSGYSNFIEIGNLEIDYIKINGSLTELLGTDNSYNQILDSILYLSKKMNVELIAECVETPAMQKLLVNSGIRYSQGYLFSKPMPIEQLYVVAEANKSDNSEINSMVSLFDDKIQNKTKQRNLFWGGVLALILIFTSTLFFSSNNLKTVEKMNNTFLAELTLSMADKISTSIDDSSAFILGTEASVSSHYPNQAKMREALGEIAGVASFDNLYLSLNGEIPLDSNGNPLDTDIKLSLKGIESGEIKISKPVTDINSGRKLFVIGTPLRINEHVYGEVFGVYYLDSFSSILDLKYFGGKAFYYLCQMDGTPIVLTDKNKSLFSTGTIFDVLDSLSIREGYTTENLREDLNKGIPTILKYGPDQNYTRTAVMIAVPGTNWFVISILTDDINMQMVKNIDISTYIFITFILLVFSTYLWHTIKTNSANEKILKKALESSYYLTNSLQSSMETDSLTKTYSRSTAQEKISEALLRDEKAVHSLLIADADNFKQINDTFGHQIGDKYLMEFVSAIKSSLRTGDILGRLGGDEFIILLRDIHSKENAQIIIERIISNVNEINIKSIDLGNVGISIGAVMIPEHSTDYMKLNNLADRALYSAKDAGKSTYAFYENVDIEQ